jgi:hypothetical protein
MSSRAGLAAAQDGVARVEREAALALFTSVASETVLGE